MHDACSFFCSFFNFYLVGEFCILGAMKKKLVVIGFLGAVVDAGSGAGRWERWRPTVGLCRHEDLVVDRLELLSQKKFQKLAEGVVEDIRTVSPETEVRQHLVEMRDPWDFQEVYSALLDFAKGYAFNPEREEYLVHITTGTHVAQICLFLLTEARYFPARLVQTSPPGSHQAGESGGYTIIDLDLSKYDKIASRFAAELTESVSFLKSGIETRNGAFNKLIEQIERVAIHSKSPLLLMGPTGAGKSQLARKIFELKKARRQVAGAFVEINCATVRGMRRCRRYLAIPRGRLPGRGGSASGLLRAADGGGVVFG